MGRRRESQLDLPRYMARKGDAFYFVTKKPRKWIALGRNKESALHQHSVLLAALGYTASLPLLPSGVTVASLVRLVRRSARARNIVDLMTRDDIEHLVRRAGGRCEISGVPFSTEKPKGQRIRIYAPSVDRIDAAIGYVPSNCRLVCASVNIALNRFGDDFLKVIGVRSRAGIVEGGSTNAGLVEEGPAT